MKKTVVALVLAGLASAVFAQQPLKPEEMIKFRKSGYSFMSWNMGKIKAQVIDNPGSFNKDQVAAAANSIAATANSGMGALYLPGTDKGKGWKDTRVKPELFTDKEGVGKVAHALNERVARFERRDNGVGKRPADGDSDRVNLVLKHL